MRACTSAASRSGSEADKYEASLLLRRAIRSLPSQRKLQAPGRMFSGRASDSGDRAVGSSCWPDFYCHAMRANQGQAFVWLARQPDADSKWRRNINVTQNVVLGWKYVLESSTNVWLTLPSIRHSLLRLTQVESADGCEGSEVTGLLRSQLAIDIESAGVDPAIVSEQQTV